MVYAFSHIVPDGVYGIGSDHQGHLIKILLYCWQFHCRGGKWICRDPKGPQPSKELVF